MKHPKRQMNIRVRPATRTWLWTQAEIAGITPGDALDAFVGYLRQMGVQLSPAAVPGIKVIQGRECQTTSGTDGPGQPESTTPND